MYVYDDTYIYIYICAWLVVLEEPAVHPPEDGHADHVDEGECALVHVLRGGRAVDGLP